MRGVSKILIGAVVLALAAGAAGQSSSLFLQSQSASQARMAVTTQPVGTDGMLLPSAGSPAPPDPNANMALRATSLIAVIPDQPRRFRVHDLVNIVVRHNMQHRADGRLEQNRTGKFDAQLSQWFRIHDWKWYQQVWNNGEPEVAADLTDNRRSQGRSLRQDQLTTRIQCEVIDVKPNGTLVIQARASYLYEEELQTITLTGIVRSEDISQDNSILSDRIYSLDMQATNEGAVRDTTKRGFVPRIFDAFKPF